MTDRSHFRFGEDPYALDDGTADRLCRGLDPADAPPAYAGAAEVLAALRAPATADELAGATEAGVVPAMAAILAAPPTPIDRSPRMRPTSSTLKLVGLGLAGALAFGGVAAATTGSLPAPLQEAVASVASPVVDLPDGTTTPPDTLADDEVTATTSTTEPEATTTTTEPESTTTTEPDTSTTQPPAPSTTTPAGAKADNHGGCVSAVAHDHSISGRDHGRAVSTAARSDCGKAGGQDDGTDDHESGDDGQAPPAPATSTVAPLVAGHPGEGEGEHHDDEGETPGRGNGNGNGQGGVRGRSGR